MQDINTTELIKEYHLFELTCVTIRLYHSLEMIRFNHYIVENDIRSLVNPLWNLDKFKKVVLPRGEGVRGWGWVGGKV